MSKKLSMGRLREALQTTLTVVGIVLVLAMVATATDSLWLVGIVVVGLLLLEAGVWGLADPLLPDDRSYHPLRSKVDEFIGDVRRLNERAVAGEEAGVERMRERLHRRVDDIFEAAGKTEE